MLPKRRIPGGHKGLLSCGEEKRRNRPLTRSVYERPVRSEEQRPARISIPAPKIFVWGAQNYLFYIFFFLFWGAQIGFRAASHGDTSAAARGMALTIARGVLDALAARLFEPVECACALEWHAHAGGVAVTGLGPVARGDQSSVDTPSGAATAHTHNIANYEEQDCFVGWPSGEDMRWVFREACAGAFLAHVCVALEGSYVLMVDPAVAALDEADRDALEDDIHAYFASRHGHRCGRGAKQMRFPCALYFMRIARAFRFDGALCTQHAGREPVCVPQTAARARAARVCPGAVFAVAFVPHELRTRGGASVSYGAVLDAPEAHRGRVRAREYAGAVCGFGAATVRLRVPPAWVTACARACGGGARGAR